MRRWSQLVNKRPWLVVFLTLLTVGAAATYGLGVFSKLAGGHYADKNAESTLAANQIADNFKNQGYQLIALFTSQTATVADTSYRQTVEKQLNKIRAQAHVAAVVSYYDSGQSSFVSKNRKQTYAAIRLSGTSKEQTAAYRQLNDLAQPDDLKLAYGGATAVNAQINDQISHDLEFAEMISFPLLAILLFLVFRSLAATLAPLAIGGMSIVSAFALVRVLTNFTDISVYAINVITIMGLGLAIDYSLFIISRFREELTVGRNTEEAVAVGLSTAGRTVLFSGLTVILCLLSLLIFPLDFLHGVGLGGSAAVVGAVALSLSILPAALRLLGPRINWLSIGSRHKVSRPVENGLWYRLSNLVMRRPALTLVVTLGILLTVGSPFLSARFSMPDNRIVPAALDSRHVSDDLKNNFVGNNTTIDLVVTVNRPLSAAGLDKTRDYLDAIKTVQGIKSISDLESTVGTTVATSAYAAQLYTTDPQAKAAVSHFVTGNVELIKVYTDYDAQSADARRLVADLRALSHTGLSVRVGGESAELVDLLHSLESRLPLALGLILVSATILLFLMLGSIVIPLKAMILNSLSLSAAFGVLVWIFQDGHLADTLGLVALGNIDAMQPVLIFAIAFGLAMDYELFLISRIKESYDSGVSNELAVATGIQKTAGIITSAALLLVVVIAAFATSRVTVIEQVGVGLAAAVIIDATIVRLVLLPASMRLLGRWNWWAPAPLARLRGRIGLREN